MVQSVEPIEVLHRSAQAKLGLMAALLAKHSFPSLTGKKPPKLDSWGELLAEQVLELRDLSAELTVTYYQLARWVETGYSLGAPLDGEGITTGNDLLSSFLARVQAVEDLARSNTEIGDDVASALKGNTDHPLVNLSLTEFINDVESVGYGSGQVKYDPFKFPQLASNPAARKALSTALKKTAGIESAFSSVINNAAQDDDLTAKLSEAMDATASKGAGFADSLVLRAGRSVADYAHQRDKRLLMFARGTSSNPCAFCAMLASRGFVYWTATSATKSYRDGGMNSYHDNCHCFPIARWVEASELPALNAYFQKEWQAVTEDYSGKEKLNAWRRWLNQKRRESRTGVRTNSP